MSRGYIGATPLSGGVYNLEEHKGMNLLCPRIIGVQDTGARGKDGATLKQVAYIDGGLREVTLATAFFDAHPSYQFPDWTDASGNVFCTIPRAYWWRGEMPDVADGTTPRWTMLLSPVPRDGFAANPGAFKLSDAWLAQFYFGKYRGHDAGSSKIGSKAGQLPLRSVTFDNYRTYCANNGTGYHMQSLFEWHEILARMVVEKKTFQLFPEAIRTTQSACKWRGIEDMAYHGTVSAEYMDGIRTDASGNYEAWDQANGTYVATGQAAAIAAGATSSYSQGVVGGGVFDVLFIASTMGGGTTSFIPDYSGRPVDKVGCICNSSFYSAQTHFGAFCSYFQYLSSSIGASPGAGTGSRLAKW